MPDAGHGPQRFRCFPSFKSNNTRFLFFTEKEAEEPGSLTAVPRTAELTLTPGCLSVLGLDCSGQVG